jgi:hypothetical protein
MRAVNEVGKFNPKTMRSKRNKYNVSPAAERTVDGVVFASKAEATCYMALRELKTKGRVRWIALQPKFVLAGGVTYRADFLVLWSVSNIPGPIVSILEVKGHETEAWKIKRKLCLDAGLVVTEIPAKHAGDWVEWNLGSSMKLSEYGSCGRRSCLLTDTCRPSADGQPIRVHSQGLSDILSAFSAIQSKENGND